MKYLPFLSGIYSTAPGLVSTAKASGRDAQVFQIDDQYDLYRRNKDACRNENIHKYYCEQRLRTETIQCINQYLAKQLSIEYPDDMIVALNDHVFTNRISQEQFTWNDDWVTIDHPRYTSLFDALCCQVQEDIAIFQLDEKADWLSAVHLCSPNHWAPEDKIGKPFPDVHAPVPGMEKTLEQYRRMLEGVVQAKSPFTRFAWGIATDTRLNHHPQAPSHSNEAAWQGREHLTNNEWYIRVERQNLIGFSHVNALLFTVRTYFYKVDELSKDEKYFLRAALRSMSKEALAYKGLTGSIDRIDNYLK